MNHSKEGPIIFSDVPTLVKSPSKIDEDDSSSSESSLTSFNGMVLHEKDPCHHPAHLYNPKRTSGQTTINHQVLDVKESFSWFRAKYILSYIAITLSDALQGKKVHIAISANNGLSFSFYFFYQQSSDNLCQPHISTSCMKDMVILLQYFMLLDFSPVRCSHR